MKLKWMITLATLGLIAVAMIVAAGWVFLGLLPDSSTKDEIQLGVFIQTNPINELGQNAEIKVLLENQGLEYIQIDEIHLPAILTDAAVVYDVFPSLYPGQHQFYDGWERFPIGLVLEPGERREFSVQFMPWQIADIANQIVVKVGQYEFPGGFRTIFNKPVAIVSTPTVLPTPTCTFTPPPAATDEPTPTIQPLPFQSVVKITAKVKYSSYLRDLWGGSGTIVSEDGLILTNAHLVLPITGAKPDVFVIALTRDPADEPVDLFIAVPVVVDEDLDLAVMKIMSDITYKPIDWQTTKMPAISLGDSDLLQLGDDLRILGYPGIGGETITLTSGNVGGFTSQRAYGERAFIKTSASISGGTSGGLALNAEGLMVAVPTQLGSGKKEDLVDCRIITDTNGDNKINQFDACIPVGGFINALRPINLARPLIESAQYIQLSMK